MESRPKRLQPDGGVRGPSPPQSAVHQSAVEGKRPSTPSPGWDPEAVQEVMGVLAREIGSPLTAIEVAVDRLRSQQRRQAARCEDAGKGREDDQPRGENELRVILEQSHRMASLARTLLSIARPSAPRQRAVELDRLVSRVAETLRPELEATGIELVYRRDGDRVTAWGDPHQLREALLALLGNARLALDEWPGERRIDVTVGSRGRREVFVRIRDTGPGVPRERESEIFLPFISSWGREGVGLALSRLSMLRQGGDLFLEEQQDEATGATFILMLPNDSRIDLDDEEP